MVFGGKFRIRRCNSKASYLPRQSLDKLNTTDPDHGSYKLTLTSNEDCISQQHHNNGGNKINGNNITTTKVYDIMVNGGNGGGSGNGNGNGTGNVGGVKITNNLPDVLPVGAKLQQQHQQQQQQHTSSPSNTLTTSSLRYGSNNSLPSSSSLSQNSSVCFTSSSSPLSTSPRTGGGGIKNFHTQSRHSSPLMSNYSPSSTVTQNNYNRSQSFDVGALISSPIKFMSQSAVDLKKNQIFEEQQQFSSTQKLPQLTENNIITSVPALVTIANQQLQMSLNTSLSSSSSSSVHRDFHCNNSNNKMSPVNCVISTVSVPNEGRIVRAELVNTHLSTSPIAGITNTNRQQVVRKNSLRENIEKITQLQSKLMSAHIAENGFLGYNSLVKTSKEMTTSMTSEIIEDKMINNVNDSDLLISSSLSENDKTIESINSINDDEIILRVNSAKTIETASQTDETFDCDNSSLSSSSTTTTTQSQSQCGLLTSNKDDHIMRTTLQPRQVHQIEVDCDNMTKDLANMLPSTDKLVQILIPRIIKSSSDYISNLYNPNVPLRPTKRDVGTSTSMRMNLHRTIKDQNLNAASECDNNTGGGGDSGSNGGGGDSVVDLKFNDLELLTRTMNDNNGCLPIDGCDLIKQKVEDLIKNLNIKLNILNTEQLMIGEETIKNDELGNNLTKKFIEKIRPIDATKYRTYIDDVGHITSLLLSLSGRLAKIENLLSNQNNNNNSNNNNNNQEIKLIESKRDRLIEQLEEAKRLKDDIDRRGEIVSKILQNNLSPDQYADYDFFVNMKAKLITDARQISDKMKLTEEQMTALSESLIQSDC